MVKTWEQVWRELEARWDSACYLILAGVPITPWSEQDSEDLMYFRRTFGYAYSKNMARVK